MGNNFGFKCTNCGYSKNLTTGIGMQYVGDAFTDPNGGTLARIIKSKAERKIVFSLLSNGGEMGIYGHEIFECPSCGELQSQFLYEIRHAKGDYLSKHVCENCGAQMTHADSFIGTPDPTKCKCSKCGKFTLVDDFSLIVYWD